MAMGEEITVGAALDAFEPAKDESRYELALAGCIEQVREILGPAPALSREPVVQAGQETWVLDTAVVYSDGCQRRLVTTWRRAG